MGSAGKNPVTFGKLIYRQMKRQSRSIAVIFITVTIMGIFIGALTAEALSKITQAILDASTVNLIYSIIFLLILILINFLCTVLYRYNKFHLIKKITISFEDGLFEKYEGQKYWQNADEALGQIRKNVPSATSTYINLLFSTYQAAVVVASGCVYAIILNYIVFIAAIGATCLMLLVSGRALGRLKNLYDEFGARQGKLYNRLWEQVKNREIAKYLIPDRASEPYTNESRSFLAMLLRIKKVSNATSLFANFGSTIMIVLVAVIGGVFVIKDKLMLSELLALVIVIPTISSNLFGIPEIIANWKGAIGQGIPIVSFLNEEEQDKHRKEKLTRDIQQITVRNLNFCYNENQLVLRNISLDLSGGYFAIAGLSGCGKTTFIKILAKLLPYDGESISINGQELNQIERESYWQQVSYACQTSVILKDTLLYNITLTEDGTYDEERLNQAITDAQLEDFLAKQIEGLNTIISSDSISKGEAQRISIARIFYRKAKVLLLDEITSALDPQSEINIIYSVKKRVLKKNQIAIFISHRIPPLSMADEVVFFKDGEIYAKGKHNVLLETNERYKAMVAEAAE